MSDGAALDFAAAAAVGYLREWLADGRFQLLQGGSGRKRHVTVIFNTQQVSADRKMWLLKGQ